MKIYRAILISFLLIVFITANILLFTRFIKLGNEPLYAFLFLAGINLNLLALLVLIFYVGKSLLKLYIDRKRNVPGHRFQIQLVSIFLVLTIIPGFFLFIIGSGLVTNYIEKWLTPKSLTSIEDSLKLARTYYEERKDYLKNKLKSIKQRSDLQLLRHQTAGTEESWHILLPENGIEERFIKEVLSKGEATTDVMKAPDGEYIRIASPFSIDGRKAVLVGTIKVSPEITRAVERLKDEYEETSLKLKWKYPLKINFVLTFGFFTVLIIMFALWTSLRISKKITEPISVLTEATMEVARGNLDLQIPEEDRKDEIGSLVRNFNIMIQELRDSKKMLHQAYGEAEAQRIRLKGILENIPSGVLSLDESGIINGINRAAAMILHIQEDRYLGRSYTELLKDIKSDELESLIKSIKLKELKSLEREIRLDIGERSLILRVFITAIRIPKEFSATNNSSGETVSLIVVFEDITDLVNAQRAMAWQEIASRIAHEVKNPLTPIKLSTERLIRKWQNKEKDFDEVFEKSTKTIIKEVESLRKLVSDFSRFGKMPEIKKRMVDMRELLRDLYYLYGGFKEIKFYFEYPQEPLLAEIDPEQIKRVLINIVDNAIEALTSGGEVSAGGEIGNIYIKLFREGEPPAEKCVISISDDGPGIPDELKERLFMPHFTTKKGGSGLGLAIAQRIVTEHRGFIKVKDNNPRGSTFLIELPVRS